MISCSTVVGQVIVDRGDLAAHPVPQYEASTVRAVIFRYLRTSGTVAETRSGRSAAMNTSAVRSSASGWLPTFEYISR